MKRNLIFTLTLTLILFITAGVAVYVKSNPHRIKSKEPVSFSETDAISMVIKEHPDFPANPSLIITKKLPIGGKVGTTANVKFTTKIEKAGDTAFKVTLTKDWGITFNGTYIKSFWKYRVTSAGIKLLDSVDKDNLPNIIK